MYMHACMHVFTNVRVGPYNHTHIQTHAQAHNHKSRFLNIEKQLQESDLETLRYTSIATVSVGLICHIIGHFCHMGRSLLTRICMPQVCQSQSGVVVSVVGLCCEYICRSLCRQRWFLLTLVRTSAPNVVGLFYVYSRSLLRIYIRSLLTLVRTSAPNVVGLFYVYSRSLLRIYIRSLLTLVRTSAPTTLMRSWCTTCSV